MMSSCNIRAIVRTPKTAELPDGVEMLASANDALPRATMAFFNYRAKRGPVQRSDPISARRGHPKQAVLSAINAGNDFSLRANRFRGDGNKKVEQLPVDSGLAWVNSPPTIFAIIFAGMRSTQIRGSDVVAKPWVEAKEPDVGIMRFSPEIGWDL